MALAGLPDELRSGDARLDATLADLVARPPSADEPRRARAQRVFDDVAAASRILAESRATLRVRPQLRIDAGRVRRAARNDDLLLPDELRRPARVVVTTPRPYLRWEPVPAPALVARHELGTGEQPARLVVRSGIPDDAGPGHPSHRRTARRSAEGDPARGRDGREVRHAPSAPATPPRSGGSTRSRSPSAARCSTSSCPASPTRATTVEQPGIALVDRPGADTGSATGRRWRRSRPTAADRSARASTSCTTPTRCGCRTCPTRTPPASRWCSTRRERRTLLPEPRALQAVAVPYPGDVARRCSRCGSSSSAETRSAPEWSARGRRDRAARRAGARRAVEHPRRDLPRQFGLWRSHLASVVDPADGYTTDEVVAAAALMRAASSGWTWWLTPSTDVRLVHAVPDAGAAPAAARR